MPSQKEIRTKIASTKKTKKITSAMKLVAAAKVNKMQKKLESTRPYSLKVKELFANLVQSLTEDQIENFELLKPRANIQKATLLVVSSDRGLCGAYNANILKATFRKAEELQAKGIEVNLVTVGRKATLALNKSDLNIKKTFCNLDTVPNPAEAKAIAEYAADLFTSGETDQVIVISTHFISMVASEINMETFLPVDASQFSSEANDAITNSDVIYEPSTDSLIETLAPMYIENSIFGKILDATTAELAARMTAMSNATTNANELISKLLISYNKARQASITQEISEIVAGAAAA